LPIVLPPMDEAENFSEHPRKHLALHNTDNSCLGCLYQQFENMNKKQPPHRTLLPHTIMAAPLVKKFLAF